MTGAMRGGRAGRKGKVFEGRAVSEGEAFVKPKLLATAAGYANLDCELLNRACVRDHDEEEGPMKSATHPNYLTRYQHSEVRAHLI
mmetsp:Transcript_47542/g.95771  ORF Transcript_47542/g.95771 Transcript_47542/m.95771 type:complete len:86 (-) Transcript_47542:84-341(-)